MTPILSEATTSSDQPFLHVAEEIFGVGLRFFGGGLIVAIFEDDFLQGDLGGVFWLEASSHELSGAGREALRISQQRRGAVGGAIMVLKFIRRQAIVGTLGFLIGQQGGDGKSPTALGTRPACQSVMRYPGKPSGHSSLPNSRKELEDAWAGLRFTSQMVCGECREPKRFPNDVPSGTPVITCRNLTRRPALEVVTA